jgi:hypothetical protein
MKLDEKIRLMLAATNELSGNVLRYRKILELEKGEVPKLLIRQSVIEVVGKTAQIRKLVLQRHLRRLPGKWSYAQSLRSYQRRFLEITNLSCSPSAARSNLQWEGPRLSLQRA